MSKGQRRRAQAQKVHTGENREWMRARLQQSNMELTRPSGKKYKREKAGARGRDW